MFWLVVSNDGSNLSGTKGAIRPFQLPIPFDQTTWLIHATLSDWLKGHTDVLLLGLGLRNWNIPFHFAQGISQISNRIFFVEW